MKRILSSMLAIVFCMGLTAIEADAAKLGGGRSMGMQRNITSAPRATPPRAAPQAAPATPPAAAPQPQSALSRWAPMLGGLAIGGLLGSMFAGGGFGGAMGSILMMALLAFAVIFVIRLLMRGRSNPQPSVAGGAPLQYSGLGNETVAAPPPSQAAGFDAQPVPVATNIPAGFDVEGFVRQAKLSYIRMQTANDAGNVGEISEFTTPEMYEALRADIDARGGAKQFTDVVTLNADLLEVVTEGNKHWASVRFSGLVREIPGQAPTSFEEVWNLAKPVDGSTGWLLAGIQQMH